ncbi:hypothetical protein [Aliikangiella sp. G2MR2-5]|uniref:hypothetical protein n=1 Tax=Aliikangiella sp. G2MR2-5 TaxID=2788943 RepID=UPI0018AB09AB|nr:hypothetical protein [Aliikangiella sp. G2MR2-5]
MSEQIVKVESDPKDEGCIQITLRHLPKKYQFWRTNKPRLVVYKGHGDHWYRLPSFAPAPQRVVSLLKAISYSPQYKHLRYKL